MIFNTSMKREQIEEWELAHWAHQEWQEREELRWAANHWPPLCMRKENLRSNPHVELATSGVPAVMGIVNLKPDGPDQVGPALVYLLDASARALTQSGNGIEGA